MTEVMPKSWTTKSGQHLAPRAANEGLQCSDVGAQGLVRLVGLKSPSRFDQMFSCVDRLLFAEQMNSGPAGLQGMQPLSTFLLGAGHVMTEPLDQEACVLHESRDSRHLTLPEPVPMIGAFGNHGTDKDSQNAQGSRQQRRDDRICPVHLRMMPLRHLERLGDMPAWVGWSVLDPAPRLTESCLSEPLAPRGAGV